jgi:type VI secretion system protein ImpH
MAHDAGTPPGPLGATPTAADELFALDFFQALRRIEAAHRDKPRLGRAAHAADEVIRLGQQPGLAFNGSTLASFSAEDTGPARLLVTFFGVFGPNGPLPLHLTEYARQRSSHAHDHTFSEFANIFHHRLLLLFYRAWANARPTVSHDRPEDDSFAGYVGALSGGNATPKRQNVDSIEQFAMYMAGHFASQSRHVEGLTKLVSSYFRVPVQVEEFVGEWLTIPDSCTWRLQPVQAFPGIGQLGRGTRIGRRVYERQHKFRLVLGPLERHDYDRFMPGGAFQASLIRLVARYVGQDLSWDVRLVLHEPDRKPIRLGLARLGRDTHLVRQAAQSARPFQDYIFSPITQAD